MAGNISNDSFPVPGQYANKKELRSWLGSFSYFSVSWTLNCNDNFFFFFFLFHRICSWCYERLKKERQRSNRGYCLYTGGQGIFMGQPRRSTNSIQFTNFSYFYSCSQIFVKQIRLILSLASDFLISRNMKTLQYYFARVSLIVYAEHFNF